MYMIVRTNVWHMKKADEKRLTLKLDVSLGRQQVTSFLTIK
jgi:hypothetical protein